MLLARSLVCILLAILPLVLIISPAVLLDQLHSGVVFGGLLEFLDSLCALLLMLSETGAEGLDAKAVVRSEGRARYVDAVTISSVCKSHCLRSVKSLQHRAACKTAPFESTEVVVADDKKKNDRINEISEAEV
jgi:hypothetical protein